MKYDKYSNNNNTLKHYLLYYNIIMIHDLTKGHIIIVIDNTLKQISNLEGEMIQNPAIKNKEKREIMNILSFLTY